MNVHFHPDTHQYFDDDGKEYPSVTRILKGSGKVYHAIDEDELILKGKRGTAVHWCTQLFDEGQRDGRKVPRALRPYRKAWAKWLDASGFVPLEIEHQFICPLGYAGTIDRVGYIPVVNRKESCVVDLKSGSAIPQSTNLQLVAYGRARFSHPCRRIAVRLGADGNYKVREYPMDTWYTDLAEYLECLRRYSGNTRC